MFLRALSSGFSAPILSLLEGEKIGTCPELAKG
jgi:hypothetical protein